VNTPGAFAWFPSTLVVDDDQVVLEAQGCFVQFRYVAGRGSGRSHIATLCGASGRNLLEDSPVDHFHHRGVWWGHGDVNGTDFYLELPGGPGDNARRGAIEHLTWREVVEEPPRWGFVEDLAWRDPAGQAVLREERSVEVQLVDGDHYTVDLASVYTAEVDIVFGDTKEAALPGIRVAEPLTAAGGGAMRNSRGQVGEAETFGQPAEWLDVSASRRRLYLGDELTEGVACFDHPANPGHPARWFTRGYGPVSPFPGHQFVGPEERSVARGAQLRYRHRLVVHQGTADDACLDDRYRQYCDAAGR
jgi:hypothetical protein